MANVEQLEILKQGVEVWNNWRTNNPDTKIDLSDALLNKSDLNGIDFRKAELSRAILRESQLIGADLSYAHLPDINLFGSNLSESNLRNANISEAQLENATLVGADLELAALTKSRLFGTNLQGANLQWADLYRAQLLRANLQNADLRGADLRGADLSRTDLRGANLGNTNLETASFVETLIDGAIISGSTVYGVSIWDLNGEFAEQRNLTITNKWDSKIIVDNIKVAQFIHLIVNNKEIKDVIDTMTSKSVLILGRFANPERMQVLETLRNELRHKYGLLPIVFDFERPVDRNLTETIKTLAGLCYFVIADVTSPKSTPLELQAIIPDYQIPVVPIIQGELPFSMLEDLRNQHDGLMDPLSYDTVETLLAVLKPAIIDPAIERHKELRLAKTQKLKIRPAENYLKK